MKNHKVSFTPTMSVIEQEWIFLENPALVETDPELQAVLGSERVSNLADPTWRKEHIALVPVENRKGMLASAQQFVAQMHAEGVTILVGSDSFSGGVPHGWGTHNELRLLVEAGIEPLEVIRMATGRAAERLGSAAFGTIKPGAVADLILLDADPLEDIENTRKISRVMQAGEWIDREALLEP